MGYFYRFHKVPKHLVKELQQCKTQMDLLTLCNKNEIPIQNDECDFDYPEPFACKSFGTKECEACDCFSGFLAEVYSIGEEIFNLGGNSELVDSIKEVSVPLFSTDALNTEYEHFGLRICTQGAFIKAVEWYRKQVIEMYEDLLREKSVNECDTRTQAERWEEHIRSLGKEWLNEFYVPYNFDKSQPTCRSGKYEYLVFELVRAYKDFDWEHYDLMFLGW